MNSLFGCSRVLAVVACGIVLVACNAVEDVRQEPVVAAPPAQAVLGGTIQGLGNRRPVFLANNDGQTVTALPFFGLLGQNTTYFTFGAVNVGKPYNISVSTQPYSKLCVVHNGEGIVGDPNAAPITVTCDPDDTAVTRNPLTVAINSAASALPGLRIRLTTEDGIFEKDGTGQASVTFEEAVFYNDGNLHPPVFKYYVTATVPGADGVTKDNCAVTNSTNDVGANPVAPAGAVTNVTVTSCLFTIGGTVGYNQPAGVAYTAQTISNLKLALVDTAGNQVGPDQVIPSFTAATATSTTPFSFTVDGAAAGAVKQFASNRNAVYDVVVKQQPDDKACIVYSGTSGANGSIANLATTASIATAFANISTLTVRCRAKPASALMGIYQADQGTLTARPRQYLAFFDDGRFMYGVHNTTSFNSLVGNNVEYGFYYYTPGTNTVAFNVLIDGNGNQGMTAAPGYATATATVNATNVQKTAGDAEIPNPTAGVASVLARIALTFTPTTGSPTVWNMTEPRTLRSQMTGAWYSLDYRRIWVFDFSSTYGFHGGVNGMTNMQDACYVFDNPAALTGSYLRRGGGTAVDPVTGVTNCNLGGFGASSSVDLPNDSSTPLVVLPNFSGRWPGSKSVIDGRPASPANYVITPGASMDKDVLDVQETYNTAPVGPPLRLQRARPN